jgi:hypothetical protein
MVTTIMKGKRDETRREETDYKRATESLTIILIGGGISHRHITKIENTPLCRRGGRAGNIRRIMRSSRIIINNLNHIAAQAIKIR